MQMLAYCLLLFGWLCGAFALIGWLPFIQRDMRLDGIGVVVFLILAVAGHVAGVFFERRIKPPAPKTDQFRPADARSIAAMLKGAARAQLLFALGLLVLDGLWLWLTITQIPTAEERRTAPGYPMIAVTLSLVFIIIVALTALACLYASFRMRSPLAGRIHAVLAKTPERLTSLTLTRIHKQGAPGDVGDRFLAGIRAGPDELTITLSKKQAAWLKEYVQRCAPLTELIEDEIEV